MVNWHKFFTSILDTISDGVFISDAMGTTLYVNQMYADLVGVPARDLRGKNVRDLVSEGFFDLALNPEVVRTGRPGPCARSSPTWSGTFCAGPSRCTVPSAGSRSCSRSTAAPSSASCRAARDTTRTRMPVRLPDAVFLPA